MRCITVNKVAADCRLPAEPFVQGANARDNHDNDNKQKEEEEKRMNVVVLPAVAPFHQLSVLGVCTVVSFPVLSCSVLLCSSLFCPVPTAAST